MEFVLLGWPEVGPTLRLDFRAFSYAGKFVMSNTGKAVLRDPERSLSPPPTRELPEDALDPSAFEDDVLAAAAFNEDRTDSSVLWLRYITAHADLRGDGLGGRLAASVAERAEDRGYRRLRIAVNNPFAYDAVYKAGFAFTGRRTGLAELILERPGERDQATYQCGLDIFRERGADDPEASFLAAREGAAPPPLTDPVDEGSQPEPGALDGDRRQSASR
ncbi:MAG: GNAT family N-acetyltransferase [Halolamina sp.]